MKKQIITIAMLAAAGFVGTSHAVDGVFEINQACASFGCVPGDTSSFPVTITESGSYRLTSNLSTNDKNMTLIQVNADNVSIDLNGFSLLGPVTCSGLPASCTPGGTGVGIDAGLHTAIMVRNGVIKGLGSDGVRVGSNSVLEQLVLTSNAGSGLFFTGGLLQSGGVGRQITASSNGVDGVNSGGFHYIMDSVAIRNGFHGLNRVFCGNSLMLFNGTGDNCTAIAPNRCGSTTDCD